MRKLAYKAALLCLCLGISAVAQTQFGVVTGRVSDINGALISRAKVTLINTATNITSTATTNDEGRFSVPFLTPGAYRMRAEKTGFKRFLQSGVEVRVSETTDLEISMQAGEISEAVEVSGSTPLLDTAGSSLGQLIE